MEQVGTVAEVWRYPIKSMGGERVRAVYAAPRGLRGDRRLAFSSSGAPVGKPMLSGEERHRMLRCTARFLFAPETDAPVEPVCVEVTTHTGERLRAAAPALMSLGTLGQLSDEMGFPVEPARFRENILLDLPGFDGFGEDAFVGRTLRIGEAEIAIKERDPRCRIITVDPATGALLPELMKLVAREHESKAGVYGVAVVPGIVAEGDPVLLLS